MTIRRSSLTTFLAAAICCPAFAQDAPRQEQPPPLTDVEERQVAQVDKGEPRFELLEAGSQPRTALRYELREGMKQTTEMTMRLTQQAEVGGMKMPAQEMPLMQLRMNVNVVGTRNDMFQIENEVLEASAKDDEANEMMVRMMDQQLRGLAGLKTVSDVDRRGIVHKTEVEMPDGMDPQMRQMASGLEQSMTQLGVHFPEEQVGQGARWRVSIPMTAQGITMMQTIEYELTSLNEQVAELKLTLGQSAPEQDIDDPGMPPGMQLRLKEMKGEGSGTTRVHLRRPAALETELNMETEVHLMTDDDGDGQEIKQSMTMKIGFKSDDPE
jgi:hypothetical protein